MPLGAFRLNTLSAAMAVTAISTITATGGVITYYRLSNLSYKVHSFSTTGNASFIVTATTGTPTASALIVGGGGAGGRATIDGSGGGGAGGWVQQLSAQSITPQTYPLFIAPGGLAGSNNYGSSGQASTAFGVTAVGGVGGAGVQAVSNIGFAGQANPGAAGSGSSSTGTLSYTASTDAVYRGGNSYAAGATANGGGGGGGAGGAGFDATSSLSGRGGNGITSNITGTNVIYGPGGGGGGYLTLTTGGYNGAGLPSGSQRAGAVGANTTYFGGGGGGANFYSNLGASNGANGRQGIVIVRYPLNAISTLTFVTSVTSTVNSFTMPTVQAGDFAVFYNTAINSTTTIPTAVDPVGWTLGQSQAIGTTLGGLTRLYYKICTGTESGTVISTMSGTINTNTVLVIYRGNQPIKDVYRLTVGGQTTNSTPASQSIIATNGPAVSLGWWASNGVITTRTSPAESREINSSTSAYLQTFEATSVGTNTVAGTLSMLDYGTNMLQFSHFMLF